MNFKQKTTSIRIGIRLELKVVLLESMVFLITASREKVLDALEGKKAAAPAHSVRYQAMLDYVGSAGAAAEPVNLESWARANDMRSAWKHLVAHILEAGKCEVFYRPLGIMVNEIVLEQYWREMEKPGPFSLAITEETDEQQINCTTGSSGRRFYYGNELILQVQDRFWT